MRILDTLVGALGGMARAVTSWRKPPIAVAAAADPNHVSSCAPSNRARARIIQDLRGSPDLVKHAVADVAAAQDQDLFALAVENDYARICLVENHPTAFVRMAANASSLTPLILKEVQQCINVGGANLATAWQAVFSPEKLANYLCEYASSTVAMRDMRTLFPRGAALATAAHVESIATLITTAREDDRVFDAAVFCASAMLVHHADVAIKRQLWQAVDTDATFRRLVDSTQREARTLLTRGIPHATAATMQRIVDLIVALPPDSPTAQQLTGWIKVAVHADMVRELLRTFAGIIPEATHTSVDALAAATPDARLTLLRTIHAAAAKHEPVQKLWDELRQWLPPMDLLRAQEPA